MVVDRDRHIVHLRQYKFCPNLDFCRLYMDYCPHGTVADLVRDYRVFSKSLPIPFLWHLFHSLALAVQVLDGRLLDDAFLYKWRDQRREPKWDKADHWTLHLDIKEVNVLLGAPDSDVRDQASVDDATRDWPSVKLADFGIPWYTSSADKRNPPLRVGVGTYDCMPPEQLRWNKEFKELPNFVGQHWRPTHMVWQIAKIVWDCAFRWKRAKIRTDMEAIDGATFEKNGHHWIAFDKMPPLEDRRLAKLLHRCLDPTADSRPVPKALVELTRSGFKESLDEHTDTKLFFRGREIKDVDPGPHAFVPVSDDYMAVRYRDPNNPVEVLGEKWSGMEEKALKQIREWAQASELTRSDYIDPWPQPKRDGKKGNSRKGKKRKRPDDSKRKKKADKNKRRKRPTTRREELLAAANPQKWYQPGEDSDPVSDQSEDRREQGVIEGAPKDLANVLFPEDSLGEEVQRDEVANDSDEDINEQPGNSRKRKSDDLDAADAVEDGSDRGANSPQQPAENANPSPPDPDTATYMMRTAKEMLADLEGRSIVIPKGAKRVKTTYAKLLRDADEADNRSSGTQAALNAPSNSAVDLGAQGTAAPTRSRRSGLRSSRKK